ncbi:MAG: hypothetical protein K9J76_07000 [Polaromonas sp.]|nr:hypothetical protein [Polaromonas sp.]
MKTAVWPSCARRQAYANNNQAASATPPRPRQSPDPAPGWYPGEAGVTRALEIIRKEFDLIVIFCVHTNIGKVERRHFLPVRYSTSAFAHFFDRP